MSAHFNWRYVDMELMRQHRRRQVLRENRRQRRR